MRSPLRSPRVRRAAATVLAALGVLLLVAGVVGARWGLLVAGVVLIGVAAATGPARIRAGDRS